MHINHPLVKVNPLLAGNLDLVVEHVHHEGLASSSAAPEVEPLLARHRLKDCRGVCLWFGRAGFAPSKETTEKPTGGCLGWSGLGSPGHLWGVALQLLG